MAIWPSAMSKNRKVGLVFASIVLAALALLVASLYGEYGGHNVSLAIRRHLEEHDDRWPSSWSDIEPYHRDPLIGIRSTAIVKRFWEVNWDVDPNQLHQESRATPRPQISIEEGILPVVFNRNWHSRDRAVKRWVLSPILQRHFNRREEELTSPGP